MASKTNAQRQAALRKRRAAQGHIRREYYGTLIEHEYLRRALDLRRLLEESQK